LISLFKSMEIILTETEGTFFLHLGTRFNKEIRRRKKEKKKKNLGACHDMTLMNLPKTFLFTVNLYEMDTEPHLILPTDVLGQIGFGRDWNRIVKTLAL